jgi:hypothetical protein
LTRIWGWKEDEMAREQYKSDKRRKEVARQKKQEEKRQKRLERKKAKEEGLVPEGIDPSIYTNVEPIVEPTQDPPKTEEPDPKQS